MGLPSSVRLSSIGQPAASGCSTSHEASRLSARDTQRGVEACTRAVVRAVRVARPQLFVEVDSKRVLRCRPPAPPRCQGPLLSQPLKPQRPNRRPHGLVVPAVVRRCGGISASP
eukprot:365535-Chlamydomonas_euryale.AAC.91